MHKYKRMPKRWSTNTKKILTCDAWPVQNAVMSNQQLSGWNHQILVLSSFLRVKRKIHHFFFISPAKIRWDWTNCCVSDHRRAPRDSLRSWLFCSWACSHIKLSHAFLFLHAQSTGCDHFYVCVLCVSLRAHVGLLCRRFSCVTAGVYLCIKKVSVHACVLHMHCVKESSSFHRLRLQELCKHNTDWQQPQPPFFFSSRFGVKCSNTHTNTLLSSKVFFFVVCVRATLPAKLLYVGLC